MDKKYFEFEASNMFEKSLDRVMFVTLFIIS